MAGAHRLDARPLSPNQAIAQLERALSGRRGARVVAVDTYCPDTVDRVLAWARDRRVPTWSEAPVGLFRVNLAVLPRTLGGCFDGP